MLQSMGSQSQTRLGYITIIIAALTRPGTGVRHSDRLVLPGTGRIGGPYSKGLVIHHPRPCPRAARACRILQPRS